MFTNCYLPSNLYTTYSYLTLRLKENESWRGNTLPHTGFSKEDKEALNAFIFIILTPIFKKELGISCDLVRFPVYFFKRLCSKAYLWDSKPANKKYLKEHTPDFQDRIDDYIYRNLNEKLGVEFTNWLFEESNKLSPETLECFEIAKSLATMIEFEEIKEEMRPDQLKETKQKIYNTIDNYCEKFSFIYDIVNATGDYSNLMQLFQNISWSRYTFRWQGYHVPVRCSILTHMLESAILGYFMFVENHMNELRVSRPETNPELYKSLEKSFTVMLFHDIAEIWTDDIPSTAKDGMGIRKITEVQELEALNKYFYSKTPDFVDKYFQDGIMLEDITDKETKTFFKTADYFSADLEIWWNIRAGSREPRFSEILLSSCDKDYRTPIAKKTLKYYKSIIEGFTFFE